MEPTMTTTDDTLKRPDLGPLVEISVTTRDLGYGSEDDIVFAYVTDEVETLAGKRRVEVLRFDGNLETWWLFEDEYENLGRVAA